MAMAARAKALGLELPATLLATTTTAATAAAADDDDDDDVIELPG